MASIPVNGDFVTSGGESVVWEAAYVRSEEGKIHVSDVRYRIGDGAYVLLEDFSGEYRFSEHNDRVRLQVAARVEEAIRRPPPRNT